MLHVSKNLRTFAAAFGTLTETMKKYSLDDILPNGFSPAPDEEDVRRDIRYMLENEGFDALEDFINREDNPYLRAYWSVATQQEMERYAGAGQCGNLWMLDSYMRRLEKIYEMAMAQRYVSTKLEVKEQVQSSAPIPDVRKLQDQIDEMRTMLESQNEALLALSEEMEKKANLPQWPFFTKSATANDKVLVNKRLRELCPMNGQSSVIKTYLRQREEEGVIDRPLTLKEEWRVLKLFGYRATYQAYNEAKS